LGGRGAGAACLNLEQLAPSRHACAVEAWSLFDAIGDAQQLRCAAVATEQSRQRRARARERTPPPTQRRGDAGEGEGEDERAASGLGFGEVVFLEDDILAADISDATHVYVSSLCFNDALLAAVGAKLAREAPRLLAVASLRPFPSGAVPPLVQRYEVHPIEMSWNAPSAAAGQGRGATATHFYYFRQFK
jgi:hypothetical protein